MTAILIIVCIACVVITCIAVGMWGIARKQQQKCTKCPTYHGVPAPTISEEEMKESKALFECLIKEFDEAFGFCE